MGLNRQIGQTNAGKTNVGQTTEPRTTQRVSLTPSLNSFTGLCTAYLVLKATQEPELFMCRRHSEWLVILLDM